MIVIINETWRITIKAIKQAFTGTKKAVNFVYILFHSQICRLFVQKYDESKPSKEILVLLSGGLGDTVISIDALNELCSMYPKHQGYRISLLCSETVRAFLMEIGYDTDFYLLEEDIIIPNKEWRIHDYLRLYRYFKNKRFLVVWDTMDRLLHNCLFFVITAKIKIGWVMDVTYPNFVAGLTAKFLHRAYTHIISATFDEWRPNTFRMVLHTLGNSTYMSRIAYIPKLSANNPALHDRYILVCLGTTRSETRWEPEKFADIINQLCERYHIPVYLCGGTTERVIYEGIRDGLRYPEQIYNYIEKTSFAQWVELIRGCTLIISADTGTVHVAAAVKAPSICIIGGWHYGILHPYTPDTLPEDNRVPVYVYNETTQWCYYCAGKSNSRMGFENPQCLQEIAKGRPALCLQEISPDDVMDRISSMLGQVI